jgi:hypothetical protein
MATASVFLKFIPGRDGVNSGDIREWIAEDEEEQTTDRFQ